MSPVRSEDEPDPHILLPVSVGVGVKEGVFVGAEVSVGVKVFVGVSVGV
jgi:hypothetical protein